MPTCTSGQRWLAGYRTRRVHRTGAAPPVSQKATSVADSTSRHLIIKDHALDNQSAWCATWRVAASAAVAPRTVRPGAVILNRALAPSQVGLEETRGNRSTRQAAHIIRSLSRRTPRGDLPGRGMKVCSFVLPWGSRKGAWQGKSSMSRSLSICCCRSSLRGRAPASPRFERE